MLKKTFLKMLFIVFAASGNSVFAQTLIIKQTNGAINTELLSSIQKLSFTNGDLKVSLKSGTYSNYNLSLIQKLYFGNLTSISDLSAIEDYNFKLFPNPVGQVMNLENIPEGTSTIYVYRMDGKMVMKAMVKGSSSTINTENLSRGVYILTSNGQNIKFIKQ